MPIRDFAELTWEQARDLAGRRPVALLPIGAIEAHGPHLPLNTDVIIAGAMARAGAERLEARGHDVLLLPPLAYTAAPFAAGFTGTISVAAEAVTSTVLGIARSLEVAALGLASAHLDPAHITSLRDAVRSLREAGLPVAFPDLTRRALAQRLTEEFRTGACHAGRFETSIVLAERPDLVREDVSSRLAPVPHSLSEAIAAGKRTFEEAGGARAYFGWPADASAEEGRRTVATLGEILDEAVLEALGSGGSSARGTPSPP